MAGIFGTLIDKASQYMTYRTYRHEVISSNIANATTPGYKAKEALFEEELETRLRLVTTSPAHLKKSPTQSTFTTAIDPYSRMGNDANTVDIDREMMKLNQNHLLYSASAEVISKKLEELRNVIGGMR